MTLGMPALSLLSCGRSVFARPLPPLLLGLAPTASTASTAIRNYARVSKSTSASTSASTAKRKGKGKGIVDPTKKVSASSPSKTEGRKRARYQLRPPRYYRGPLHPHQPPPPWSPNSREFVPGPFGRERTLPLLSPPSPSLSCPLPQALPPPSPPLLPLSHMDDGRQMMDDRQMDGRTDGG